jgi:dTDP-4-dehydrorhamnose reductase
MRPTLVVGGGGQLGTCFAGSACAGSLTVLRHGELDVTDAAAVRARVRALRPAVILNCAAYNRVDAAEGDAAAAFAINAEAVGHLADAAAECEAVLVHFSTDFVFDGEQDSPYTEEDPPNPLCVYGRSKLAGETNAARAGSCYVLRLSSLFGGGTARSFIDWTLEQGLAGRPVSAFVDRTVSPSYAPDVVAATAALLDHRAPFGVYHCASSTGATWYEVAAHVLARLGRGDLAVGARFDPDAFPARRPRNCMLSTTRIAPFASRRGWEETVDAYLDRRLT